MMNVKEEFLKFKSWLIAHKDTYQTILAEKPYCIEIKSDSIYNHDLILFKYNQIESDFSQPFVKLCRGLVLDAHTFDPIVFPFVKFHNFGEIHADNIDWKSCYVADKIDGSLVKIVRIGNDILIGTNSTIDAYKAPLVEQIGCIAKSFGELAYFALLDNYRKARNLSISDCIDQGCVDSWLKSIIKPGFTYMFELTSPFNKVVVQWHDIRLNFLGVRNNETLQETYFLDHELKDIFNTPKVFPLHSIDECIKAAEQLDCNAEGYVVCDKNFNRVKIKSPTYVALHHMRNNGALSYERGIEIVRRNEIDEVLTYFPEFKEHLLAIQEKYNKLVGSLEMAWCAYKTADRMIGFASRKDSAIWIQKNFEIPGVGFALLDKKYDTVKDWILNCPAKNLVKWLGFKD